MKSTFSILVLTTFIAYSVDAETTSVYKQCLQTNDGPGWFRSFDFENEELPLQIEVTERASHWIVSHILSILLRERLGYSKVVFSKQPWDRPSDALDRLSCGDNEPNCKKVPQSTINLEVWMPPGFNVESWVNRGRVVDCGPLGPTTRRGIFTQQQAVDDYFKQSQVSLDHWRAFLDTKVRQLYHSTNWPQAGKVWKSKSKCTVGQGGCIPLFVDNEEFIGDLRNLTHALYPGQTPFAILLGNASSLEALAERLNRSAPSQAHLLFVNWFPNTVTVRGQFSRLALPDCYGGSGGLGAVAEDPVCQFEVNQLTKVVWYSLFSHAPRAYQLVDQMQFSQQEYEALLSSVKLKASSKTDLDAEYFDVACNWVRANRAKWTRWTPDFRRKEQLVIGGMFTFYGKWVLPNIDKVALRAVEKLNSELFETTPYKLVLHVRNLTCEQDIVLEDYLRLTQSCTPQAPIIGIIAALCSDSIEPMVKLTNLQRRIVVSPTVESGKFMSSSRYQYFFRTIPSMRFYNSLLVSACKRFGWRQVVLMRKDDHFLDQKVYKANNISIVDDFEMVEKNLNFDNVKKYLKTVKKKNGRIFILEYFGFGTRLILCAASRLNMSLSNGYVWFLNPWLLDKWWKKGEVDAHDCTDKEMANITSGYFFVRHLPGEDYTSRMDMVMDKKKGHFRNRTLTFNFYSGYTTEAVRVLGLGIKQLLKQHPSALSALLKPRIAQSYRDIISKLDFSRKVMSKFSENVTGSPGRFNSENSRTARSWALDQKVNGITMHVFIWNTKNDTPQIIIDRSDFVNWLNPENTVPEDGSMEDGDSCIVSPFHRWLNISCVGAVVILNVLPILCVIGTVIIIICYCRKRIREAENFIKKPYDELCTELSDLDMPSSSIVLNRRVGQGAFGLVYGGEAKRKNRWEAVAVKVINQNTSYQGKIDFLSEAKLMRDLKHPNVVQLIGICLHPPEDVIYLVMEFMLFGDLKTYLLSRRVNAAQDPDHDDINPTRLTQFTKDIARGVEYMHSLSLIHRDIACRNCLVGPDKVVKIGDFGLTRKMSNSKPDGYYRFTRNCELPIRWMSPEAVQFGVFSIQSDVWSFGVVLYEIITFGVFPYDGLCDVEVVERVKRREFSIAEFLPQTAVSTVIGNLIVHCCQYRAEDRPHTMSQVLKVFEENPNCVQPFLTDEPPKPAHVNLNNLPFQPGVGACNMTEAPKNPPGSKLRSSGRGRTGMGSHPGDPMGMGTINRGPDLVPMEMDGGRAFLQQPADSKNALRSISTEFLNMQPCDLEPEYSTVSAPGGSDSYVNHFHGKPSGVPPPTQSTPSRHRSQPLHGRQNPPSNGYLSNSAEERELLLMTTNRV